MDAKRCLCATDASDHACPSADSVCSLVLQGGVFSADEAAAFSVARTQTMRCWDDRAKVAGCPTPGRSHFLAVVARVSTAA